MNDRTPEETAASMLSQYGYAKACRRAAEYELDAKWATPRRSDAQEYWAAVVRALIKQRLREEKELMDGPFGRQPRPVLVTVTGDDQRDVDVAIAKLIRVAESAGDMTQRTENQFWIYPRAVND